MKDKLTDDPIGTIAALVLSLLVVSLAIPWFALHFGTLGDMQPCDGCGNGGFKHIVCVSNLGMHCVQPEQTNFTLRQIESICQDDFKGSFQYPACAGSAGWCSGLTEWGAAEFISVLRGIPYG